MDNPKLFVSYAGEQSPLAEAVSAALRGKGIDAYFAGWEIEYGGDIVAKLNSALGEARFVVFLVSEDFLRKAWPRAEQSAATFRMIAEQVTIIPVNLGVPDSDFPPLIRPLRRVPGEIGDADAIATDISRTVFGISARPPLGELPGFVRQSLVIPGSPDLTASDRTVLRLAFEIGAENRFRASYERLAEQAGEAGIDPSSIDDSLAMLKEAYLLEINRYIGGIHDVTLTVSGAEACCAELVENYGGRKRAVLAAIVNGPDLRGTDSDDVAERAGEPRWLVCHALRHAAQRSLIAIHPVYVGHEYYSIDSISPRLKRDLQEPERG